jgi:predicted regulator of Ras-like GTPase activity (Roadblock/LC7/MglB family)
MNIVLSGKDIAKIDGCLGKMVMSSAAHCVFLIDRSGQLIAHSGNPSTVDVAALSALTAANFGATAEIAKLLGESEFNLLFHKGKKENIYFSAVGEHLIVVIIFDHKTSLGLVRLRVNKATDELLEIFTSIFERSKYMMNPE